MSTKRYSTRSTTDETADSDEQSAELGEVGYRFKKYFPGYGYFNGMVVKVKANAANGKDRRCVYADGEQEDLTLKELRDLRRLDTSSSAMKRKRTSRSTRNCRVVSHNSDSDLSAESEISVAKKNKKKKDKRVDISKENKTDLQNPTKSDKGLHSEQRSKKSTSSSTSSSASISSSNNNNKNKSKNVRKGKDNRRANKKRKEVIALNSLMDVSGAEEGSPSKIDAFESLDHILPTDTAAEATLTIQNNKHDDPNADGGDDEWLEKMASLLGASDANPRPKRKKGDSIPKEILKPLTSQSTRDVDTLDDFGDVDSTMNPDKPEDKEAIVSSVDIGTWGNAIEGDLDSPKGELFTSLADCNKGERYGKKILNNKDDIAIVGEVLMEHSFGWVEVIINGNARKARASNCIIVPEHYNIGDEINKDLLNTPKKVDQNENNSVFSSLSRKSRSPSSSDQKLSIHQIFYWCCTCKAVNNYTNTECATCNRKRDSLCQPSALLEVAEKNALVSSTVDEALASIPPMHRSSFPKKVLSDILPGVKSIKGKAPTPKIESYFYWNCGSCTMTNSYKKFSCTACKMKKYSSSVSSLLLHIAENAASKAHSVEEALAALPPVHAPAIPKSVLENLITCSAVIGKDHRRCQRQRVSGEKYCHWHLDTKEIISGAVKGGGSDDIQKYEKNDSKSEEDEASLSTQICKEVSSSKQSLFTLVNDISNEFEQLSRDHVNKLNWNIHCIEDAIFSQNHSPFPIGMLVRRFFPGYGFHDGYITNIHRQLVAACEGDNGNSRPVLLYRVKYNDGDGEDLMQHEINSLRQLYNQRAVESTASVFDQLVPGTCFETFVGIIEIVGVTRCEKNIEKDGKVCVKFSKNGERWSLIQLPLTKLQLSIIRKLTKNECVRVGPAREKSYVMEEEVPKHTGLILENERNDKETPLLSNTAITTHSATNPNILKSPNLEWPITDRSMQDLLGKDTLSKPNALTTDDQAMIVPQGLWMSKTPVEQVIEEPTSPKSSSQSNVQNACCIRPGTDSSYGWDPTGALEYLSWDPFKVLTCSICKSGHDDHLVLICDKCHRGFHTYCVRPVIVNIPTESWECSECATGRKNRPRFADLVMDLRKDPTSISSFLSYVFSDPAHFCILHKTSLDLFAPKADKSKRLAALGPLSMSKPIKKLGTLYFSRTKNKHIWLLPIPLPDPVPFCHSLATMVAAMQYCGMEAYSEELVFKKENGVTESMNDASLENVESLSKLNLETFEKYKENLKLGVYPPIRIVYDDDVGFTVEALAPIPRHTLITEYVGEVITVENSCHTSSDSLMILLDTGDPKTSLIIDPTREGNIARFLSGINNRCHMGRRKANVRTRRFALGGRCKVALFASKDVKKGEFLHYDYNAGNEGKSIAEWAETGFYDTSNFV